MSIDFRPTEMDIPVVVDIVEGKYVHHEERPEVPKRAITPVRVGENWDDPVAELTDKIALSAMNTNCFCVNALSASKERAARVIAEEDNMTEAVAIDEVTVVVRACYENCVSCQKANQ